MSQRALGSIAVTLAILIGVVFCTGRDQLPASLRSQIDSEQKALDAAQKQFHENEDAAMRDVRGDAAAFAGGAAAWSDRFHASASKLQTAASEMTSLERLRKEGHKIDRVEAENLLRHEKDLRSAAVAEAAALRAEADQRIDFKRNLPKHLEQMAQVYQAARSASLGSVKSVVEKAESDWPEKKADLQSRLSLVEALPASAEKVWDSTADVRKKAAAGDLPPEDFNRLFAADQELKSDQTGLTTKADQLKSLTGQLYNSWDKVLADLDTVKHGDQKDYEEKIKTIRTRVADSSQKAGETTSDESWVEVPEATYLAIEKNLGMTIEHKSAGKYDFEADKTAQPPGYAYIAPPSQGSNQYGYWEHRDGGMFWSWLPQYLLMRELFYGPRYIPVPMGDWEGYRTAQRSGQVYYGHDEAGAPKYGSHGTFTESHYANSRYVQSGSYRSSKYATNGGGYRSSQYATPGVRSGGADEAPHQFGSGSSGSYRRTSPSSPRPSRSFGSGGRRFGGGRRR